MGYYLGNKEIIDTEGKFSTWWLADHEYRTVDLGTGGVWTRDNYNGTRFWDEDENDHEPANIWTYPWTGNSWYQQQNPHRGQRTTYGEPYLDTGDIPDVDVPCVWEHSKVFGHLYNWTAVDGQSGWADLEMKIEGWHVPTFAEWNTMFTSLGADYGAKAMSPRKDLWYDPEGTSTGHADFGTSGLDLLPGGYRKGVSNGEFENVGYVAHYWTSTSMANLGLSVRVSNYSTSHVTYQHAEQYGYAVRLMKDGSQD